MPILVACSCGRKLQARDEFAGTRAECPTCGRQLEIPAATTPQANSAESGESETYRLETPSSKTGRSSSVGKSDEAMEIVDFLDPPKSVPRPLEMASPKPVFQRMMESLLDPRAIQWMLTIGGGLAVIGLVIWLISLRVFDDPRIVALAMGSASLAILGGGWWIALKTAHKTAGRAFTFLGCVVAPLNLWFYHAQNLITLDQHLWLGGLVCVGLYVATVLLLRDPLFLYAVEAGVTLTLLLLLADLGKLADAANLSLYLLALGFLSIHAERAFAGEGEFSRKRYGLPLFWSGHAQLGTSLLILLGSQLFGWLTEPLKLTWGGNLLTQNSLLAGGIWIAATYLYFYSDYVVRRIGLYLNLAAFSLVMAQITLVLQHVDQVGLMAVLAITSLAIQLLHTFLFQNRPPLDRQGPVISALLAELPVLMGVILHLRATSALATQTGWAYATDGKFVAVMVLVAVCNRVSAYLTRKSNARLSATYFFFSAAGVLVAAAGLLRQIGWTEWYQQSAVLMLIPIAYLVASRLWRGHSPETPLARVAQASTAVILLGSVFAALEHNAATVVVPVTGQIANLLLGLTFLEATLFYAMAGVFRRRSANASFATIAACGALWQFLGYFGVPSGWHTVIYAVLGVSALAVSRMMGLELVHRYGTAGERSDAIRGSGLALFQCGNGVLTVALVAAFLKGLGTLATSGADWLDVLTLALTATSGFLGAALSPPGGWRRWYLAAGIAVSAVGFLTLNVLINLNGWQKLEVFCVTIGLVLLAAGHAGRFRESTQAQDENVSLGLWMGSLLGAVPLFIAMVHHRFFGTAPSLPDELALVTVTMLMLVSGCGWQIKSTTLVGGSSLGIYLLLLFGSLAYRPEVAVGVYLLTGGGIIFLAGVLLSLYRDRLLAIPEQIARREGLFKIIDWR